MKGMILKMIKNVKVLNHACIKFEMEKTIYVDPFEIKENYKDADIILITHEHYDHYSPKDINRIKNNNSILIVPEKMKNGLEELEFEDKKILTVKQNDTIEIDGIKIETIPAYNVNKRFHPKENGGVGYIIEIENKRYFVAGDTDITEENKKVKCEVAFVPVGGTYTMNYEEAAKLINIIKPQIAVPIHYGSIVGSVEDAKKFINLLEKDVIGEIIRN